MNSESGFQVQEPISSILSTSTYPHVEENRRLNPYEWITGGEVGIQHEKVIGEGGFGSVHKVFSVHVCFNLQMYNFIQDKVRALPRCRHCQMTCSALHGKFIVEALPQKRRKAS
jgi:hypothetical protein